MVPLRMCWVDTRDKIQGKVVLSNMQTTTTESTVISLARPKLLIMNYTWLLFQYHLAWKERGEGYESMTIIRKVGEDCNIEMMVSYSDSYTYLFLCHPSLTTSPLLSSFEAQI